MRVSAGRLPCELDDHQQENSQSRKSQRRVERKANTRNRRCGRRQDRDDERLLDGVIKQIGDRNADERPDCVLNDQTDQPGHRHRSGPRCAIRAGVG